MYFRCECNRSDSLSGALRFATDRIHPHGRTPHVPAPPRPQSDTKSQFSRVPRMDAENERWTEGGREKSRRGRTPQLWTRFCISVPGILIKCIRFSFSFFFKFCFLFFNLAVVTRRVRGFEGLLSFWKIHFIVLSTSALIGKN